jgi:1-acyl-sn-glycerol-3-phosphate acyltransferase
MIRYVSLNAFIALWSILMCLWGLLISLVDRNGRKVHFYCAVPWARTILWICGIKVHVNGLEHVDPNAPRIYMTNHQSFFDIFGLLACLPVDFKFILKQELMKIPFLGPAMRKAGYIGIERDDPRKAVESMKQAADRIKNGASVLIFPEGTRSPDGRLQGFKRGGFNLAIKAGCDIVPIGIRDSFRIATKGSLKIKKGAFWLSIGRPISLSGLGKRDIPQLMEQVRSEMVKQMEAEGPETGAKADSTNAIHLAKDI